MCMPHIYDGQKSVVFFTFRSLSWNVYSIKDGKTWFDARSRAIAIVLPPNVANSSHSKVERSTHRFRTKYSSSLQQCGKNSKL